MFFTTETRSHGANKSGNAFSVSLCLRGELAFGLGWFFLAYAFAHFELHLARLLVGVDDHVIAVEDFAVENLERERILHQLLDGSLQRTHTEVRAISLRGAQSFWRK